MNLKEQADRGELMLPEVALELSKLEGEVAYWQDEAVKWRNAHHSVVVTKRRTTAKYGAIMRKKPGARLRRIVKRIKRCVTKITDKLRRVR